MAMLIFSLNHLYLLYKFMKIDVIISFYNDVDNYLFD